MLRIASNKSLRLNKETLRVLSNDQLRRAAGGGETQTCGEDTEKTKTLPTPSGRFQEDCAGGRTAQRM